MYGCKFVGGPHDGRVEGFTDQLRSCSEIQLLVEDDLPVVAWGRYFRVPRVDGEVIQRFSYRETVVLGVCTPEEFP
jgi:hypothetical protein